MELILRRVNKFSRFPSHTVTVLIPRLRQQVTLSFNFTTTVQDATMQITNLFDHDFGVAKAGGEAHCASCSEASNGGERDTNSAGNCASSHHHHHPHHHHHRQSSSSHREHQHGEVERQSSHNRQHSHCEDEKENDAMREKWKLFLPLGIKNQKYLGIELRGWALSFICVIYLELID
jgi:hypothetical protein